jgi:hypothetical protein
LEVECCRAWNSARPRSLRYAETYSADDVLFRMEDFLRTVCDDPDSGAQ